MNPEEMLDEEMTEEDAVEDAVEVGPMDDVKASVQAEIDACMADVDAGVYTTPEEVYDAVIAKMEALKGPGASDLGGLGDDEGMVLPEEEPLV
jgi:predicted transcriptional regulator